jgi:hypothetical protein
MAAFIALAGCATTARPRPMASKKASGRNVAESERSTVRLVLRVPPDVAEDIDALAARLNLTRSGAVAWMLERVTTHPIPEGSAKGE